MTDWEANEVTHPMRKIAPLIVTSLLLTAIPASAGGLGRVGEETFRCTTTVGGGLTPDPLPNLGADTNQLGLGEDAPEAAVGGCELRGELVDTGIVVEIDTADGCAAYADVDPTTPGAEMELEPGMPVKKGTGLWAYCEAGVMQAENAVTIDFGS